MNRKIKSALSVSAQDASAALPQNCQTTSWIVGAAPIGCKRHFGNSFISHSHIGNGGGSKVWVTLILLRFWK